jgi:hypothetical protein
VVFKRSGSCYIHESGSLVTTRIILAKKALTLYVEEHARGLSLGKERQTDHNKALMMRPTTANINQMKVGAYLNEREGESFHSLEWVGENTIFNTSKYGYGQLTSSRAFQEPASKS